MLGQNHIRSFTPCCGVITSRFGVKRRQRHWSLTSCCFCRGLHGLQQFQKLLVLCFQQLQHDFRMLLLWRSHFWCRRVSFIIVCHSFILLFKDAASRSCVLLRFFFYHDRLPCVLSRTSSQLGTSSHNRATLSPYSCLARLYATINASRTLFLSLSFFIHLFPTLISFLTLLLNINIT